MEQIIYNAPINDFCTIIAYYVFMRIVCSGGVNATSTTYLLYSNKVLECLSIVALHTYVCAYLKIACWNWTVSMLKAIRRERGMCLDASWYVSWKHKSCFGTCCNHTVGHLNLSLSHEPHPWWTPLRPVYLLLLYMSIASKTLIFVAATTKHDWLANSPTAYEIMHTL